VCILLMNSCMCTRTCVCMYTHLTSAACSCTSFIYARIHKFEYIYTHTGVSVCARICGLNNRLQQSALLPTSYTYTYTHTISTHIYAQIQVHRCACMCSQMWSQQSAPAVCSCTNFDTYTYTHTHINSHIRTHTSTHIAYIQIHRCVCMCSRMWCQRSASVFCSYINCASKCAPSRTIRDTTSQSWQ